MNTISQTLRKFNLLKRQKIDNGIYEIVFPEQVGRVRNVPDHIEKPSYYALGIPKQPPNQPEVKNQQQIDGMIESCRLASGILKKLDKYIQVGMTTDHIDEYVHRQCIENGAYPSPLKYRGFPKSICTSVNNVVCHGIPDSRRLTDGDIINVDITVYLNGFHGDCSKTYLVGDVDEQGRELVSITEQCLLKGISVCGPGVPFRNIGYAIYAEASRHNYNIVKECLGHGIGSFFHGPPDIYHSRNSYPGNMEAGMTFTIEPALCSGNNEVGLLEDGWTLVTTDNSRSAQAEHTVLIVEDGCKILTDQHINPEEIEI